MAKRLDSLQAVLLHDTVLEEWLRPMQKALDAIRYSRNRFSTLTAEFFISHRPLVKTMHFSARL
jgi:hypothetical protein